MLKQENNKLKFNYILLTIFVCFIITLIIKANIFLYHFPSIDSAFYIKWLGDLNLSSHILPLGDKNFIQNLMSDPESFLHQLFRRYYNNSGELYTILPILINYIFTLTLGTGFISFNLGSIIFSSLLSALFSFYFCQKYQFKKVENIFLIILINLFFIFSYSFFKWSVLGIHNYSIFFLLIGILVIDSQCKKKIFFDFKLIILAIILPCFSHKFNVPLIFLSLFFIIILRKKTSNNFNKEIFFLIILFLIIILPLIIGTNLNPNNINFLNSFFSGEEYTISSKKNFFSLIFNYEYSVIKYSIPKLIQNYFYNLGFIGIILFGFSLYKTKNNIFRIFLISNLLIFLFLPIATFSIRIFNYQLIVVFLIFVDSFCESLKDKKNPINKVVLAMFMIFTLLSANSLNIKKSLNKYESEIFNVYYKDNQILKEFFISLIAKEKIDPSNIVFGNYLTKDLFYSYLYSTKYSGELDSFPAINSLWINRNNNIYLQSLKIDLKKLHNPFFLYFYSIEKKDLLDLDKKTEDALAKFCELRSLVFGDCGKYKLLDVKLKSSYKNQISYNGQNYTFKLIKIIND